MNRTTRTVVVMAVATLMAGIASLGVYAAVKSIPVREVEVAHTFVAVAARNLPTGSRITEEDVKLVAWPARNPVAWRVLGSQADPGPRPRGGRRRKRTVHGNQAGAARVGCRLATVDSSRHACHVGEGRRSDRRRRLRRAGHPGRSRRHASRQRPGGRVDVAHRRQQRARPDGRHQVRPGAGEGWQGAAFDGRHARRLAE